jgi:hypothetical protein
MEGGCKPEKIAAGARDQLVSVLVEQECSAGGLGRNSFQVDSDIEIVEYS